MIVTGENAHETFSLDKCFHEVRVGPRVFAVVVAVADVTLITDQLFVQTWPSCGIRFTVLIRAGSVRWDVYEGETRDDTTLLLVDGVAR